MASSRTDKYWTRLKASIAVPFFLFLLYILAYIIQIPAGVEDPEFTFSTYPAITTMIWLFLLSLPLAGVLFWHSLYKDKQELSKEFSDVEERHWITIAIFSHFSAYIYPLWYLYARYRRTKEDTVAESGTSATSKPDESPTFTDRSNSDSSDNSSSAEKQVSDTDEVLNKADDLRDEATDHCAVKEYDHALKCYDEAEEVYNEAIETTSQTNISDIKEIRQKLDSVNKGRQEVYRQQIQDEIESIRSSLNRANARADEGDLEGAREILAELEIHMRSVEETATQRNLDEIKNEINMIENQRKQRLMEITERMQTHPVPDKIPPTPDVSINYNALTDEEPIGGGGNADVTMATLPTSAGDVTVAIKEPRMAGTLQMDTVDQILEEAETWNKLDNHDHIVSLLDYGDAPMPWIAMEYMDGGHLGSKSGVLDMSQSLWTAIAITKGVRHAHRRGVAHLDLKPENVLFRSVDDGWDIPKVADWGLSKHLLDQPKSVEGLSPQYAAPEQFDEDFGSPDDITDIYQLGAVFYELFTGSPPFEGKPAKTMNKVLHEEPTSPSKIADVPDKLDKVLLKSLAKEKHDRHGDIVYLRDELQELFDNW